jgi:tetratricopeptide (TPR) repeat protein
MKFNKLLKYLFFLNFLLNSNLLADNNYFAEGQALFIKKEFAKAKFKFEQDLVYNPKSEKSYLYLSKIYSVQKKKDLEVENLKTVILLNPKNEEAIYNFAQLKLNDSDFVGSNELIEQLLVFCDQFCEKARKLKIEIEKSLKK